MVDLDHYYPKLVLERNYTARIGKGSDGEVFFLNTTPPTVLKRFFPDTPRDVIIQEHRIGTLLSHHNIARTHSLTRRENSTASFWELSMEYIAFPLLDLLDYDAWAERPWSITAASCLFAQIVEAATYLHEQGFAHRDLKVENIMVTQDGVVKLIDFGSAEASRNPLTGQVITSRRNWVGTPVSMAPEVHGEKFVDMEKADIWSLGIVFVRILLGEYPWNPEGILGGLEDDAAYNVFLKDKENDAVCRMNGSEGRVLCRIPEEARKIVAGMLEVGQERRISLFKVSKGF
jgi:serine/threonine protein kinase